ncbi:5-oxoprolinase subunit PxpA [Gracilibacillus salitolerans]|uniref:5-oxoprolinase subunit A n=1 Tax=Gracilibacillus salitolerans TaxID=2663022 RepID=A0A5Q2TIR8_9BACI|nr:5-oxoprolinase subunit PxpA [Gracilibacillus salitolerans]QGH34027.1 5-oxoprolinase subunit PxpA [Gracilibacillus salitolerans]
MAGIMLNCDLGESFGTYRIGNDGAIIPLVDAVNIACGFHAGDPHTMNKTVKLAKKYQVNIGAHPGFQDLQGFGRRNIDILPEHAYDLVVYQLGALQGFVTIHNLRLAHVKPHGALYNMACKNRVLADAIAQAVNDVDPNLVLVGLAHSELINAGEEKGLQVANEVFADRTYQPDGSLTPRSEPDAVIHDTTQVIQQVEEMVTYGKVTTVNGEKIPIKADTICVHGDTEEALSLVQAIRKVIG